MRRFHSTNIAAVSPPAGAPPASPTITVTNTGLSSMIYDGAQLMPSGNERPIAASGYYNDGTTALEGVTTKVLDGDGKGTMWTFPWGTINFRYTISANVLNVACIVHNTKTGTPSLTNTIGNLKLQPIFFHFPNRPAEHVAGGLWGGTTTVEPIALGASYTGGCLAVTQGEIAKSMHLTLANTDPGTYRLFGAYIETWWTDFFGNQGSAHRPIGPGETDTLAFDIRFGTASMTPTSNLLPSFYSAYRSALPYKGTSLNISGTSIKPIVEEFVSNYGSSTATNPRGYFSAPTLNALTDPTAFHTALMNRAAATYTMANSINAQGVIVWDLEGNNFPIVLKYIGAPNKLSVLAPEMFAVFQDYVDYMTTRGLRVGCTLRPQVFGAGPTLPAGMSVDDGGEWVKTNAPWGQELYYWDLNGPGTGWGMFDYRTAGGADQQYPATFEQMYQVLRDKVAYSLTTWGLDLFYVDSNTEYGTGTFPIPAWIFEEIKDEFPDIEIFPEHERIRYAASTIPYNEARLGTTSIYPGWVDIWPEAKNILKYDDLTLAQKANYITPLANSLRDKTTIPLVFSSASFYQDVKAEVDSPFTGPYPGGGSALTQDGAATSVTNLITSPLDFTDWWTGASVGGMRVNWAYGPDGTLTGEYVHGATAGAVGYLSRAVTLAAGDWLLAVYFLAGSDPYALLEVYPGGANDFSVEYNLSTLSVNQVVSGTIGTHSAGINDIGNGWKRAWLKINFAATATPTFYVGCKDGYVWGAMLYAGTTLVKLPEWSSGSGTGVYKVSATDPAATYTSIAAVNSATILPGEQVLFKAGETFSGSLVIPSNGSASNRIIYGSYGTGRATISSGSSSGIVGGTREYIDVKDLIIVGGGNATTTVSGVVWDNSGTSQRKGPHLTNLEVSAYGKSGIEIKGSNSTHGFDNVRITDCVTYNCTSGVSTGYGTAGIMVISTTGYANTTRAHTDLVIDGCTAYSNPGIASGTNWSGSGIFVGQTSGGTIQYCETYDNGAIAAGTAGGSVGCWAADSTSVVIQYCESYENKTAGTDGCGFDLDGGCVSCIIQYCYSHDNEGAGYLVYSYPGDGLPATTGNIVRYNISIGDADGIIVRNDDTGTTLSVDVYNNTFYTSSASAGGRCAFINPNASLTARIHNNIFQNEKSAGYHVSAFGSGALTGITITGNCYFSSIGSDNVFWGSGDYKSVGAWLQAQTSLERVSGVVKAISSDPKLTDPTSYATTHGYVPVSLTGLQLSSGSPVADRGIDLNTVYGIDPGPNDFFGNAIPVGSGFAIGCHDRAGASTSGEAAINATYTVIGTADGSQTGWQSTGAGMRDGNDATGYFSNAAGTSGAPQGLIADIGSGNTGKVLTKCEFRNFDTAADATNGLTVAVSADASTWTEVGAISGAVDNTLITFYLGHRTGIRYIRAQRAESGGIYAGLADFIIYGI